jgi:hypothetical protein
MNDENLTGWEKFGALLTTILTTTITLISSTKGLKTAFETIGGAINKVKNIKHAAS